MLFAKGTRVRLRHSHDKGVVTEILDKELLMVQLDGEDMEIPVFTEDLERAENESPGRAPAKIIGSPTPPKTPPAPPAATVETQYAILKSFGIQLAFDPAIEGAFRLYLLNDTNYDYLFHFAFLSDGKIKFDADGKINAVSALELGTMPIDDLNATPEAHLECRKIMTDGPGPPMHKELKIKAKKFFSKTVTAPILNRPVHLYRIFDRNESSPEQVKQEEDLKTYTLRKAVPNSRRNLNTVQLPHEVAEYAGFIPEIDLHIENLTDRAAKMSNAEIMRIQLSHFERFMDKALRVGAERVFIIHGVGKGRLRDAIATRLMQMEYVKTFQNNYHPRYGFGATEVILR
ncbi:MAG: DUF2027 domain-containing protein [Saprospiraceae bacterium]|nr:DUF2027 domain-containing protein [Saprospiraceae bacterium]